MFFSICVPVYNRKDTILRTLDSIKQQKFSSYEVIIVDDGSTDGSADVVSEFIANDISNKFQLYRKKNGGKHSALNVGIEKAKGDFFIILDSDDWLTGNALEELYPICNEIKDNDEFCGVMGRSQNYETGEMIGDMFDLKNPVSSYFEYHFVLPQKMYIQDCFEAVKTQNLKAYRFPEKDGMKFVPEAWLFDQLGVSYKLLLTNTIFEEKQYLENGMTMNPNFKRENVAGFLYHYISRIENVIYKKKMPLFLKMKLLILAWWRYWQCVEIDTNITGPRIQKVTLFGKMVKVCSPVIDYVFIKKYPNYAK